MDYKNSAKYIEAMNTLSDELKPIFEEFVSHYRYSGTKRYGKPFVSYIILADMVRAGWRCVAPPQGI